TPSRLLRVSVVIKALDEERHIRASIESALAAVARVGGEVIVADSGSSDRTVDVAREYPVTIVQLKHPAERRCGVGPQLGYQTARGEFVYILDGDMELDADFLPEALAAMGADSRLAGIAGLVDEQREASYQFCGQQRRAHERRVRVCEWLDSGGLYRVEALREVGYFSNRNLHACEEMELGLRLCAAGWTLQRLAARAVQHHRREEGTWPLLARRWRTRHLDGAGELIRASAGRPYFYRAIQTQQHLLVALLVWVGGISGVLLAPFTLLPLAGVGAAVLVLVLVRARRVGSLADAWFGQVAWQVTSLAMLRGLLVRPRNPAEPVEYVVLREAPAQSEFLSCGGDGPRD
ncbi:MAG TPA: glycosyltransferase, partial [Steroidobacteraceae bacterium]|nr:glycosyltransferase [Steroidobacteraceae bacterium]